MPAERWGAYSVIDHRDALKIARDLILFDRLLMPCPEGGAPWKPEWDPEGMLARIESLGDRAIAVNWTPERRESWKRSFEALKEDERDINAGLMVTRRVLIDHMRDYRPVGVDFVEVFEGFQSEAEFVRRGSPAERSGDAREKAATVLLVIAQRLATPVDENPDEALKRALELTTAPDFVAKREAFHHWRRDLAEGGRSSREIADAARALAEAAETGARARGRSARHFTAGSAFGVSLDTAAVIGDLALNGLLALSVGAYAFGRFMAVAEWRRAGGGGAMTTEAAVGAMFHETKRRLGWEIG